MAKGEVSLYRWTKAKRMFLALNRVREGPESTSKETRRREASKASTRGKHFSFSCLTKKEEKNKWREKKETKEKHRAQSWMTSMSNWVTLIENVTLNNDVWDNLKVQSQEKMMLLWRKFDYGCEATRRGSERERAEGRKMAISLWSF